MPDKVYSRSPVWPLVGVSGLLLAAFTGAFLVSVHQNQGHFVYVLDDPYIHMAMAKNVARHGVWGISSTHFTSSSSSLLWTAALAALFFVFGVHVIIPLMMNVLLAIVLLVVVFRQLSPTSVGRSPVATFFVLLVVAFAAPLPGLVFVGQEHILHAIVTLLFVSHAATTLSESASSPWDRPFVRLCLLAFALPLIRYEALFLICIVATMLLARRRWRQGSLLAISALMPVAVYGAISQLSGWYWLPNSVILKGSLPGFASVQQAVESLGYISYSRLMTLPAVAFLLYGAIAAFIVRMAQGFGDATQWILAIFALVTLAHTQFAQPQAFWFYRYEAYLVVVGSVVVAQAWGGGLTSLSNQSWPRTRRVGVALASVLFIGLSPLPDRAVKSLARIPQASANIYQQHYQIGSFLNRFYRGATVALNDIGAPSYMGDIECLDLVGLANMEVARRRLAGWFQYDDMQEIAESNHASIAIVYDSWFRGQLPKKWIKAGTWSIRNNIVTGDDTVTFYALRPDQLPQLTAHLREFSRDLPGTVTQKIASPAPALR